MRKKYVSKDGTSITWESNTAVENQTIRLWKYGDKCSPDNIYMGTWRTLEATANDYRLHVVPGFARLESTPYPTNLRADLVYNRKPYGYGGRTAPDRIIVWGLHGASATTFFAQ